MNAVLTPEEIKTEIERVLAVTRLIRTLHLTELSDALRFGCVHGHVRELRTVIPKLQNIQQTTK